MRKYMKVLFLIIFLVLLIDPVYAEEVSKVSRVEMGCNSISPLIDYLSLILGYIRIIAVALAVIFQVKDYLQVTFAGKPADSMKKANTHLYTRLICIGVLFIVPTLVIYGLEVFDTSGLIDRTTCGVK